MWYDNNYLKMSCAHIVLDTVLIDFHQKLVSVIYYNYLYVTDALMLKEVKKIIQSHKLISGKIRFRHWIFSVPDLLITGYPWRSCSKLISRIRRLRQGKHFLSQILSSYFPSSNRFLLCHVLFVMPDINFKSIKGEMDRLY